VTARDRLLELLFPRKCPFCQHILAEPEAPVCPDCQPHLPWLTGKGDERRVDFTAGCLSPLAYRDSVPEAVRRYKFGGVRAYAHPFSLLMAQCAADHALEADCVTWVPLSAKRLRRRGYDQAELLSRGVGERLGLPAQPLLQKIRDTQAQSDLETDGARRANALGAYVVLPGAGVEGRRILLVDDVVTSGATLSECARMLRQAGAEQVWALTLAQARSGRK